MLLLILALVDLRTELRLLADQLTITSLIFAVRHHSLAVVVLVIGYHHACSVLLRKLADGTSRRSHVWFRWFNEAPVLLLLVAVVLVVVKPF